jgi:tetratricopeptide (TPR) repeat protein
MDPQLPREIDPIPLTDLNIAEHYNTLGQQLYEQGNYTAAVNAYGEALKLEPGSAEIYNNLGLALEGFATPVEAIVAYKMALQIDPQLAPAQQNLQRLLTENPQLDDSPEAELSEDMPLDEELSGSPLDEETLEQDESSTTSRVEDVLRSSQTDSIAPKKSVSNNFRSPSRDPNLVVAGLFLSAVVAMGTGAFLISIDNGAGGGVFSAGGTMMGACVTMITSGRSRKESD